MSTAINPSSMPMSSDHDDDVIDLDCHSAPDPDGRPQTLVHF